MYETSLLVVLGCGLGCGSKFFFCDGSVELGQSVGGLGWVKENGPTEDNSAAAAWLLWGSVNGVLRPPWTQGPGDTKEQIGQPNTIRSTKNCVNSVDCCSVVWVNSALHPSEVTKSSTSFGWGKGWNVTSAGWQVTLCDPIWHVNSSSGVATSVSELLYSCYFTLYIG